MSELVRFGIWRQLEYALDSPNNIRGTFFGEVVVINNSESFDPVGCNLSWFLFLEKAVKVSRCSSIKLSKSDS